MKGRIGVTTENIFPVIKQFLYSDHEIFLRELVANAVRHGKADKVQIAGELKDGALRFSVRDTGIGIPEEEKERIFERFYRIDKSHSKSMGGTGLGLSIVKHAAKIHKARIELNSVIDGGTTVTVAFPKTRL